jgi:hypothetical protein
VVRGIASVFCNVQGSHRGDVETAHQDPVDAAIGLAREAVEGGRGPGAFRRDHPCIVQVLGCFGIGGAVGSRCVEVAGDHDRHVAGQGSDALHQQPRAAHARVLVLLPIRQMGIEQVEAAAVGALEQGPGHHARQRMSPADAAGDRGRVGQPKVAGLEHPQAVLAIEHAHVLVAMAAAAIAAEPGVRRQLRHQVIALPLEQFLGADQVGRRVAQHARRQAAPDLPTIGAVGFHGQADVEAHHPQRRGGRGGGWCRRRTSRGQRQPQARHQRCRHAPPGDAE